MDGLDVDELVEALSEESEFPVQCRRVSQPFKQFLLTNCQFTNRIEFRPLPKLGNDFRGRSEFKFADTELVGGITPSGFFCGALVIVH